MKYRLNLEKEMATHSSVLAWRIPGMGEPGGLPSMGSHRVGHNWSDLAAAAALLPALYWEVLADSGKVCMEENLYSWEGRGQLNSTPFGILEFIIWLWTGNLSSLFSPGFPFYLLFTTPVPSPPIALCLKIILQPSNLFVKLHCFLLDWVEWSLVTYVSSDKTLAAFMPKGKCLKMWPQPTPCGEEEIFLYPSRFSWLVLRIKLTWEINRRKSNKKFKNICTYVYMGENPRKTE